EGARQERGCDPRPAVPSSRPSKKALNERGRLTVGGPCPPAPALHSIEEFSDPPPNVRPLARRRAAHRVLARPGRAPARAASFEHVLQDGRSRIPGPHRATRGQTRVERPPRRRPEWGDHRGPEGSPERYVPGWAARAHRKHVVRLRQILSPIGRRAQSGPVTLTHARRSFS